MLTLPSGLVIALSRRHIMEPDKNWFRAPDDHFWYWTPAPDNQPPFRPTDVWEAMPKNMPVPTSREEMAKYIHVVLGLPDGMMYWQGDFLSDFPYFMQLDETDLVAWREWANSDHVKTFLDETIQKCQAQAAINKECIGHAVLRVDKSNRHENSGHKVIDNPLKGSH